MVLMTRGGGTESVTIIGIQGQNHLHSMHSRSLMDSLVPGFWSVMTSILIVRKRKQG